MNRQEPFRVRIKVRHYELDTNGHLNHAVYHSYAEVARLGMFEAAANGHVEVADQPTAPVLLESTIKFRRELRLGDVVTVTCDAKFNGGKTFQMDNNIYKADGTLAAAITCTLGLMDLRLRRLVDDPQDQFERAGIDLTAVSDEASTEEVR